MKYELFETEEDWLKFINKDGIKRIIDEGRPEDYIGKKVFINNKETPDYNIWQMADFNHDNSGYTVDLICANTVCNRAFNDDIINNYVNSDIRTWLNDTYYNGFSDDIKEKMDTMIVETYTEDGIIIINDKVKLLSCREMNLSSYDSDYMPQNEGNPYPIFSSYPWNNRDNSVNKRARSGADSWYWLRSRNTNNTNSVWSVLSNGYLTSYIAANSNGIVPVLRFKNV